MCLQPRERFVLSTPGLRDQCSNHWANEANTLFFKIDKSKKTKKQTKMCCPQRILMKKQTD